MSNCTTFIGLDAHKQTIIAAILLPRCRTPEVVAFGNNPQAIRRFVTNLAKRAGGPLAACYEAGPLGFDLLRQLEALGVEAKVIAPSKIWAQPGNQIKTDRRDAVKLVNQFKAQMLTTVHPPNAEQEAVRDLCRAREDAKADETRAKNRLAQYLLR